MIRILNISVPISALALALADAILLYASVTVGLTASYATLAEALAGGFDAQLRQIVFVGVMLISLFAMGLYHRQSLLDFSIIATRVLIAAFMSFIALNTIFYLLPSTRIWISALMPAMVLGMAALTAGRMLARRIFDLTPFKRRVLVLGTGAQAEQIKNAEESMTAPRFKCVGFVSLGDAQRSIKPELVLMTDDLMTVCRDRRVDEIVLALDDRRGRLPLDMLLHVRLGGVPVFDIITFFEREAGKLEVDLMRPSWLILSDSSGRGRVHRVSKRLFDIVMSLLLFAVTVPFTVVTVLAILIEEGRPIFYRQERVGLGGKSYVLIKFRSMRADAEKDGIARWAALADPRITRVGRLIRRLRIDEIPQLINVLRGEMSFVGPRPERSSIVKELSQAIPFYAYRHAVKPGITGWAQINYPYGASVRDAMEKLKYDLYYIKNHSLFLDVVILIQTLRVIFLPQGAR